jgi:hypothetical protein
VLRCAPMRTCLSGALLVSLSLVAVRASAQGYGQPQPYGSGGGGSNPYGGPGTSASPQGPYGQERPSSLQAGGLTAPESEPDPEHRATEQQLERAEAEDSGRGLEFVYLNVEFGVEHLDLQLLSANDLVDTAVVETSQTGLVYGAGLGLRFVYITAGARFRFADFSAWQLWTLNGEVGLRIPIGNLEPFITAGAGFASLGALGIPEADVDITGYNVRLGGGVDYYVTPVFSVGAAATAEILGLTRSGVSPSALPGGGAGSVYAADGSGVGLGVTGTLLLGLHF